MSGDEAKAEKPAEDKKKLPKNRSNDAAKDEPFGAEDATIVFDRNCTDMFCCLIFLVFIVGMVLLSGIAFTRGQPLKLLTPFDSTGFQCGANAKMYNNASVIGDMVDLSEYKYKYLTLFSSDLGVGTISKDSFIKAVCVKECPKNEVQPECNSAADDQCTDGKFSASKYDTSLKFKYYCVPSGDDFKKKAKKLYALFNEAFSVGQYMTDVVDARNILVLMMIVTLIISVLYVVVLRWIVKPVLYISMVLIQIGFIGVGFFAW